MHNARANKEKRARTISRIIGLMVIVAFVVGLTLLVYEPLRESLRSQRTRSMVQSIDQGQPAIRVRTDELSIDGEQENAAAELDMSDWPNEVELTALGILVIDAIDLKLPLFDDASIVPLRYGAGALKGTARPGEVGNMVVLGHRMRQDGQLFNRLDEIKMGDFVIIHTLDKQSYHYDVREIEEKVPPSHVPALIADKDPEAATLTLITCTPVTVGSHRIVITCYLIDP